ncbi:hypothetical protein SAMN05519104_0951 [Rhizobiales bacterium GAS188]|nr:hypothetical protein SAMN05519104_0951 [Rhizobiales bacterium GAS188]
MSLETYIDGLSLSKAPSTGRLLRKGSREDLPLSAGPDAWVDVGSLLSFVSGVDTGDRSDILFSLQLAQRAADAACDRFAQTRTWYSKYNEVLEAVGWITEQFAFAGHDQTEGDFRMDKAALSIISAIATVNQLQGITASISALENLIEGDDAMTLFDSYATAGLSGNFQIGAVQKAQSGALSMALGAFYFRASSQRRKFLFAKWGRNDVNFWTSAQKMTFNTLIYANIRSAVQKRLGRQSADFIAKLVIA